MLGSLFRCPVPNYNCDALQFYPSHAGHFSLLSVGRTHATVFLRPEADVGCDVGADFQSDSALAGDMQRTLSLLRDEDQANLRQWDLT